MRQRRCRASGGKLAGFVRVNGVSSAEFRQIENRSGSDKADRLFRAAVSAFAGLRRPTRSEITRLDDLAAPLLGEVSRESRRFAAAALADSASLPPRLARQLIREDADIAAPLLVHGKALSDAELVTAIALRGLEHARLVARRPALSREIEALLAALNDPEIRQLRQGVSDSRSEQASSRSEATRRWLREMMAPAEIPAFYRSLRDAAFSGRPSAFEFRLADGAGISLEAARAICRANDLTELAMVMAARGITAEQAFLLICALRPQSFDSAAPIRQFIEDYEALDPQACREILRGWRVAAETRSAEPEKL